MRLLYLTAAGSRPPPLRWMYVKIFTTVKLFFYAARTAATQEEVLCACLLWAVQRHQYPGPVLLSLRVVVRRDEWGESTGLDES